MTEYAVPYGRSYIKFRLPAGFDGHLLKSNPLPPVSDVRQAIDEALRKPLASPTVLELARPRMNVVIVVTDATRACPDHLLAPPLLNQLNAAGVPDDDITIMAGIGMHRAMTPAEAVEKLGDEVVRRIKVVNPTPNDPASLVDLGEVAYGVPCLVNRQVYEADLLLATGIVEPHHYAGYSGGPKTVAIGCSSPQTIQYSHGPAMLDHPRVRLAQVEGNPFHQAISEIGQKAGLRFVINVVMDEEQRVIAVRAGDPQQVKAELVQIASPMYTVPIKGQFDIAIAGVGYPKDANFYQASRAASYLQFAPEPVVRKGGVIIIPAVAQEGAGQGAGEQAFLETMRRADTPAEIIADALANGYQAGGQRAYMLAKVLESCDVIVVGSQHPDIARQLKFLPAANIEEALAMAASRVGSSAKVAVIPHALMTLPVVRSREPAFV